MDTPELCSTPGAPEQVPQVDRVQSLFMEWLTASLYEYLARFPDNSRQTQYEEIMQAMEAAWQAGVQEGYRQAWMTKASTQTNQ